MPHLPDHQTHDPELVAAYAAGDATGAALDEAAALVAGCADCGELHRDLRAIAAALPELPAPTRPRDFRLTAEQAASLRPRGWRGLLETLAGPRFRLAAPLGTGLAALGIAALLVAPGGLPATGAGSAATAPGSSAAVPGPAALAPAAGGATATTAAGAVPAAGAAPAGAAPAASQAPAIQLQPLPAASAEASITPLFDADGRPRPAPTAATSVKAAGVDTAASPPAAVRAPVGTDESRQTEAARPASAPSGGSPASGAPAQPLAVLAIVVGALLVAGRIAARRLA